MFSRRAPYVRPGVSRRVRIISHHLFAFVVSERNPGTSFTPGSSGFTWPGNLGVKLVQFMSRALRSPGFGSARAAEDRLSRGLDGDDTLPGTRHARAQAVPTVSSVTWFYSATWSGIVRMVGRTCRIPRRGTRSSDVSVCFPADREVFPWFFANFPCYF